MTTKAKKNIRRCVLHKISYEACMSWVLLSLVNNEIFSNLLGLQHLVPENLLEFIRAPTSISRKLVSLITFPKIIADIFSVLKTIFLSIQKQQVWNISNSERARWQFSQKIGGDLKQTDHLSKGSVELLWLHKMMCPYKRTHLAYAATNFCNLGVGTRWQGYQTDSVKWQWNQVTILVHHPSTSFPSLYNSCFTWGYCHSLSVVVNCYLKFSFDVTRVLRVAVICEMAFKTNEPWQNSCNFWHQT